MIIKISDYDVLIDDEDYEKVMKYKWYLDGSKENGLYYFRVNIYEESVHTQFLSLHRYLMDCIKGDGKVVDHINGNTLDNRKENLRVCTHAENGRNRKKAKNNTSGYKGVCFNKNRNKWQSYIKLNSKIIHLGYFSTAELAYEAYCKAVPIYHKEFGRVK